MFEPGSNFGYSHTNYAILGRVPEKIAGMPPGEAMRKYIFGPMNLPQTQSFSVEHILLYSRRLDPKNRHHRPDDKDRGGRHREGPLERILCGAGRTQPRRPQACWSQLSRQCMSSAQYCGDQLWCRCYEPRSVDNADEILLGERPDGGLSTGKETSHRRRNDLRPHRARDDISRCSKYVSLRSS